MEKTDIFKKININKLCNNFEISKVQMKSLTIGGKGINHAPDA